MAELKNNLVILDEERMMRRDEIVTAKDPTIHKTQATGVSRQQDILESFKSDAQGIIQSLQSLENKVQSVQHENLGVIRISLLPNKNLRTPIEAVVERDGESFIARTLEIPLYGCGEDFIEAVAALKYEIESLYDDLMEDNNFTNEWLKIKDYLRARIADN